jgi:hypothetical protein
MHIVVDTELAGIWIKIHLNPLTRRLPFIIIGSIFPSRGIPEKTYRIET